jgi:hypothetical protein
MLVDLRVLFCVLLTVMGLSGSKRSYGGVAAQIMGNEDQSFNLYPLTPFRLLGDESLMSPKAHGTCPHGPAKTLRWGATPSWHRVVPLIRIFAQGVTCAPPIGFVAITATTPSTLVPNCRVLFCSRSTVTCLACRLLAKNAVLAVGRKGEAGRDHLLRYGSLSIECRRVPTAEALKSSHAHDRACLSDHGEAPIRRPSGPFHESLSERE